MQKKKERNEKKSHVCNLLLLFMNKVSEKIKITVEDI